MLTFPNTLRLIERFRFRSVTPLFMTCLILLGLFSTELSGQPPFVIATGGKQEIVHDGTENPQVFPSQKWNVIAPQSTFGASVQWEASPFRHVEDSGAEADIRMDLSIRHSTQNAQWKSIYPTDQTNIAKGRRTAGVVAMSNRRGNAQVELVVTFIESPENILVVGDYEAIVTATITEN